MEFIKDGSTLPIPLNLIPTPSLFIYFYKKIKGVFIKDTDDVSEFKNEVRMKPNGNLSHHSLKEMSSAPSITKPNEGTESLTYKVDIF